MWHERQRDRSENERDIVDKKQIASLLAAVPLPIVLIGPDERITQANSAAESLFGPGILDRHFITVMRQPDLLESIEAVLAGAGPRDTRYLGYEAGRETTYVVHCAPVVGEDDNISVLVSLDDVTAVEEAGQMRRDFVANVSHELRTPLTALSGFIETLRGAARDDAAARDRFLSIMENEAARMNRLVLDLLSLSRVEDDERQRPTATVDLSAQVNSVLQALRPFADDRDVTLRAELGEGPTNVIGDSDQLRQVVSNLTENAIKYGGKGGEVVVSITGPQEETALRAPGYRLIVRDNGDGIAPEHIARLTERFYRVDTHRSREMGGTGLGLAIVKHIVNRHRGRLKIESTLGQGSQFMVILPAATDPAG
ncbi:ATP-binding protein [Aliiroseovarius sp. YM-037]|uniref:ATP-binding protein n=1 Tax=Aliiroseovarius sp. YM-037 TaxID=3341728 RepID=UPI003A7FB044